MGVLVRAGVVDCLIWEGDAVHNYWGFFPGRRRVRKMDTE